MPDSVQKKIPPSYTKKTPQSGIYRDCGVFASKFDITEVYTCQNWTNFTF